MTLNEVDKPRTGMRLWNPTRTMQGGIFAVWNYPDFIEVDIFWDDGSEDHRNVDRCTDLEVVE